MTSATAWPSIRRWLTLAGAVVLPNIGITLHNVWPTPLVTWRYELSIDFAVVLLALVLCASFLGRPSRLLRSIVTFLLVLLVIGRYADITAPALYGRPVSFYWDAQHLPNVIAMLAEAAPWWMVLSFAAGLVALLAALTAVLGWCVNRISDALDSRTQRRLIGVVASAALALFVLARTFEWPARYWYSIPVSSVYFQQVQFIGAAYAGASERRLPNAVLPSSDFARLGGGDFLLVFLESYGAATYDSPAIADVVAGPREAFAAAAEASQRQVVSAFFTSPTFGGVSWLAHSSFMSGIEVRDAGDYQLLLTQERETLPKRLKDAGYRAVALMPGLKNPWPEGVYYGFDQIYGERELDYRGAEFGWWRIPDQYAFAKLGELEPTSDQPRAPLFVFLPTINTHMPFLPVPPYQADWQRLLTPNAFDPADVAASVARSPEWTRLDRAYADAFAYTFTYLAGYLRERAPRHALLVFLGDHQPAASVAGTGARWDVPVHVVTENPTVAAALKRAGFVDGVALGAAQPPIGTLPDLSALLLETLNGDALGDVAAK